MAGVSDTKCVANTGQYAKGYKEYIDKCANTSQVSSMRQNFFKNQIDFDGEFKTMKALADSEVSDITGLLAGTSDKSNALGKYIDSMKKEESDLKVKLDEMKSKTEALNAQFVDRKSVEENKEADKGSKISSLQDYTLAALFIAYLFFALTFTLFLSKSNGYSIMTFVLCISLFTVLGLIMWSIIHYVA
jgi:hypothetical protein